MPQTPKPDFVRSGQGTADSIKWHLSRRQHPDMDPFWVADMDFTAPTPVLDALRSRVADAVFGYSFVPDTLFETYAAWSDRRYGYTPPPHNTWLPGVMSGVHAAVNAFSEPGDGVIIQPPVYFPFAQTVRDLGRTLVENPLIESGGQYRMNLAELEAQASAGAKVLLLCSPHNPVGRVWTQKELQDLMQVCVRNDVVLISDEIHADLIVSDASFVPAARLESAGLKLVTLVSATKTFNIPGLPGAFAYSRDDSLLAQLRASMAGCGAGIPNVFTLTGTEAAWRDGDEWLTEVLSYLRGNELCVRDRFSHLPLEISPLEGTYLLWIKTAQIQEDDEALARRLKRDAQAWLIEGSKFGAAGAGFLRMNIATDRDRLDAACRRIVHTLEEGL